MGARLILRMRKGLTIPSNRGAALGCLPSPAGRQNVSSACGPRCRTSPFSTISIAASRSIVSSRFATVRNLVNGISRGRPGRSRTRIAVRRRTMAVLTNLHRAAFGLGRVAPVAFVWESGETSHCRGCKALADLVPSVRAGASC